MNAQNKGINTNDTTSRQSRLPENQLKWDLTLQFNNVKSLQSQAIHLKFDLTALSK